MEIIKKQKNNQWHKKIKFERRWLIKCQDYEQLKKVLKFFEDYTDYVYEDTKEKVSSKRKFSDSLDMYPTFIVTDYENETLYTSPINPLSRTPTYSTAFLIQMNAKIKL